MENYYQLVFVVETSSTAKTDSIYLNELLKRFYDDRVFQSKHVTVRYVYMNGKNNFDKLDTRKEISKHKNHFHGLSFVIYVSDLDHINQRPEDIVHFEKLEDYCEAKKFKLIWFVRDIEDVLLPHRYKSKQKVQEAKNFILNKTVNKISSESLKSRDVLREKSSNFLVVMDQIFAEFK